MSGTRPKHETTWNDYKERILRVLTHIQEHLDEALDLEELARLACFSSFHFHRIFAAMTGETIADHVRRLRLERAALELRSGAKQVIQVALDAGYEAHEAFTRAFKSAYGVSPTKFRRATGPIAILAAPSGVHFRPVSYTHLAGRTPRRVIGPEHEVVNEELRAAPEEVCQRGAPRVGLEPVLLADPNPRKLLSPPRQLVAAPRQLLLFLEQLEPGGKPFLRRYDVVFPTQILRFRHSCFFTHNYLSSLVDRPSDQPVVLFRAFPSIR